MGQPTLPGLEAKRCTKCNRTLPFSSYYRDGASYRANCKDCHKADVKARWWRDPEASRARERVDPKRKQRGRERMRQRRAADPEYGRDSRRRYAARPENRKKLRRYLREWKRANPERVREYHRRREAAKRQMAGGGTIRRDLLAAKLAYWGGRCWIAGPNCLIEPKQWDHVKPLSKGGPHLLANLRPACTRCNTSKKDRWPFP
jgi:5-methylcytosine-specific restriction endonuclease McrA